MQEHGSPPSPCSPSPAGEGQDQYLLFWDHESVLATEEGVEYLSPPQKALILIQ